jgi:hypothetical protein
MGVLAVWSVRGRDLVPHLTEQTTNVRGFQILVEAFRLWELYEPGHPQHAGRLDDFFLLIEQTFARTVGWHDKNWPLPGSRRAAGAPLRPVSRPAFRRRADHALRPAEVLRGDRRCASDGLPRRLGDPAVIPSTLRTG